MSDPAGRLNIELVSTAGRISCRIRSSRPVTAVSMFAGRTLTETATLLPMLFSICGKAQAAACAEALEQALDARPDARRSAARRRAVAIETIREHAWRMLLDWPRVLGEAPDRVAMAAILSATKNLLSAADPEARLFLPATTGSDATLTERAPIGELDALLRRHLFGVSAEGWLEQVRDDVSFRDWCQQSDSVAARLMRSIIDRQDAELGWSLIPRLPDLQDQELEDCLQGPAGLAFLANPRWQGQPHETTAFARGSDHRLMLSLNRAFGPGILARLAAQLVEVAELAAALAAPLEQWVGAPKVSSKRKRGLGFGRADAARGRLIHRVEVDGNRVTDYRILAPTEWNFHPQGVVADALSSLPASDEVTLRRRAELVIMATDPCVAYDLVITTQQSPA